MVVAEKKNHGIYVCTLYNFLTLREHLRFWMCGVRRDRRVHANAAGALARLDLAHELANARRLCLQLLMHVRHR